MHTALVTFYFHNIDQKLIFYIVLFAELLKQLYPKLVELHNYPSCNSFTLKLDNWITINRKILQKINLNQSMETLKQLCNSCTGIIESLLWQIKSKYNFDKQQFQNNVNDSKNENINNSNSKSSFICIFKFYMKMHSKNE